MPVSVCCLLAPVPGEVFEGVPESPNDAVLLLKERMASTRLSQRPLLLLPVHLLSQLPPVGPNAAARNMLGKRELMEYRKTSGVQAANDGSGQTGQ